MLEKFRIIFLLIVVGGVKFSVAQVADNHDSNILSETISWHSLIDGEIRINWDKLEYSKYEVNQLKVSLITLPSNKIIQSENIHLDQTKSEKLIIKLHNPISPDANDLEIKVRIDLQDPPQTKIVVDQLQGRLENVGLMILNNVAYTKVSREKHFLLNPSLSLPTGGGAEIGINRVLFQSKPKLLINQLDFGLNLDKGSGQNADANFLNLGLNFRMIVPFHFKQVSEQWRVFDKALTSFNKLKLLNKTSAVNSLDIAYIQTVSDITDARLKVMGIDDARQSKETFFRGLIFTPLAPRLETNFKGFKIGSVTNFINNSDIQIRTSEKTFLSPHLFWSLKLIPAAFEAGVTIRNKDNRLQQGRSIFRFNVGGATKISYRFPCKDDLLANRIELEINGMNRHLFNNESAYNGLTGKSDLLINGNKYFIQVDLRYILGFKIPFPEKILGFKIPTMTRRPALTVTYKNGYFPPVYAFTNAVTFHITLQSDDKDNYRDITRDEKAISSLIK